MNFMGKKLVNLLIESTETPDTSKFKENFNLPNSLSSKHYFL